MMYYMVINDLIYQSRMASYLALQVQIVECAFFFLELCSKL